MKKYTFVIEYKKGTYICQYRASNLLEALNLWRTNLDRNIYTEKDIHQIHKEINDNDYFPTPIESVDNIWCCTFLSGRSFLLLNIVETV